MQDEEGVILLVEDDHGHAEIVQRHFKRSSIPNRLMHVQDGQAALDYLYRRDAFISPDQAPRPALVLLDLRLPKVDGTEVLRIIKADPDLTAIPVVVLTTSASERDMAMAYKRHANSYLVKPVNYLQFAEMIEASASYWLKWNQLPLTAQRRHG